MALPSIPFEIPSIETLGLPFDIPTLIHPAVVHFMIALPIIVLLLEVVNLIMRKRAIGGVNFLLLFFVALVSVVAYVTGVADGKEASVIDAVIKDELLEHKLLGTWLMLASLVVFFFKFISATTQNGVIKAFYLVVLIGFVVGILKQGQEGGELVYEYGVNVKAMKKIDAKIFDLEEKIEILEATTTKKVTTPVVIAPVKEKIVTPAPIKEEVIVPPSVEEEKVETLLTTEVSE